MYIVPIHSRQIAKPLMSTKYMVYKKMVTTILNVIFYLDLTVHA